MSHIGTNSTCKYMLFNRTIFMLAGHMQVLSLPSIQMSSYQCKLRSNHTNMSIRKHLSRAREECVSLAKNVSTFGRFCKWQTP